MLFTFYTLSTLTSKTLITGKAGSIYGVISLTKGINKLASTDRVDKASFSAIYTDFIKILSTKWISISLLALLAGVIGAYMTKLLKHSTLLSD